VGVHSFACSYLWLARMMYIGSVIMASITLCKTRHSTINQYSRFVVEDLRTHQKSELHVVYSETARHELGDTHASGWESVAVRAVCTVAPPDELAGVEIVAGPKS